MLSILIPTYNYNVYPLANKLMEDASRLGIPCELICMDDGSGSDLNTANERINNLPNATFLISKKNNGRTLTRQLLAKQANNDWLLFLDADVMPKNDDFLKKYMDLISDSNPIIFGGIAYNEKDYQLENSLRFKFGSKREVVSAQKRNKLPYRVVCSANFLTKKNMFLDINALNLNHAYGMDYIFGMTLKTQLIPVKHIDNEVYHLGIDENHNFLAKTKRGLQTLHSRNNDMIILNNQINLLKYYRILKKLRLHNCFGQFMLYLDKPVTSNLVNSKNPSLFLFDLYRLGYFCRLK